MRRILRLFFVALLIPVLLSCNPEPKGTQDEKWCYMLYLCSANLTDFALQNLNEIARTVPNDNAKIYVMTGGTTSSTEVFSNFKNQTTSLKALIDAMGENDFSSSIGKDNYQYWEFVPVQNKNSGVFREINISEKGMNDPNVLKNFINICYDLAGKDNKYILDLWGHAGGSLMGLIVDYNYEDELMSLEEFKSAMKDNNLVSDGKKFETVIFNTCLMQNYETAGILEPYAHYMIGSEENSSALGPDYMSFIQYLYDNPDGDGKEFGEIFCSTALKKIENLSIYNEATWSNIDLTKYSEAEEAFNNLIECVDNKEAIVSFNLAFLNQANVQFFSNFGFAGGVSGMFDLRYLASLMKMMYEPCSAEADNLMSKIDAMVVSNYTGKTIAQQKHAQGLSVFFDSWCFPKIINNTIMLGSMVNSDYYESYKQVIDTGYADFLENLSNAVRFIPNLNTWTELDSFITRTSITSISFVKTSQELDSPVVCYRNTSGTELYFVSKDTICAYPYCSSMFASFSNLTSLNLTNLDTSYVMDMSRMFYGLSALDVILADEENWLIQQYTNITDMFTGCKTDHVTFVSST